MKKLSVIMVALIGCVTFLLTGCGKTDKNTIRVNEVTHSIFYAPMYVAINKGYFKDEGLTIKLTNGGGSNNSMTALLSGSADIALMGPETTVYTKVEGKKDLPKIFAQLTKRDGSFLIGRNPIENFSWDMLKGKEVLGGRAGGMPAMALEYTLTQKGLIKDVDYTFNHGIQFDNMTAAFMGGAGDFVTAFEPAASEVVASGKGYILASVGEACGEVPFTAFMANDSYLNSNKSQVKAFLRAVLKGYEYLTTAKIDDIVEALYPSFKQSSKESIKKCIENYIAIDAWVNSPVMEQDAFNRLITILKDAGQLKSDVAYSDIIDNTIANELMAEKK